MFGLDFFDFFRYVLGWVASIYATVVTLQSLWGWYVFLTGGDKYITLVRRYVIVHGLRLRVRAFWGDVLICLLLCVVFVILFHAHGVLARTGESLAAIRHAPLPPVHRTGLSR